MALAKYKEKRDFRKTPEPKAKKKSGSEALIFVVQKHSATNLHYDFRLEADGVLKSWAIPKGPSLNPSDKRLAMMVEDHPYDYKDFEGIIPKKEYGGGEVIIWDAGTYHSLYSEDRDESEKLILEGLGKGEIKFVLNGKKLKGEFVLVKMKGRGENAWLLIKHKDNFSSQENILEKDRSVISGSTIEDLKNGIVKKKALPLGPSFNKILNRVPFKKFPHNIKPMLASLIGEPFDDENWLFEIKLDGYRAIAEIENGNVELNSRNNNSFNKKYPSIVESLKSFNLNLILDGEIIVLDNEGKSNFQLLQIYGKSGKGNLIYYVFDILYYEGKDLRSIPLKDRKEILKSILPGLPNIRFNDHILNKGKAFFKLAESKELEGIIAKNLQSKYLTNKRSREWLKIKIKKRQEAIIGGYTKPKGSRDYFGALVLGAYNNQNELIYIGHTGGGFSETDLKILYDKLRPLEKKTSPFKKKPQTNTPATWVSPELICEVEFSEWTEDGLMRHPVFLGLREDKKAGDVIKEIPGEKISPENNSRGKRENMSNRVLKISNPNKIYWPDEEYTKGDLINYYKNISRYILPYLRGRPESLLRHPNGINGESFFQKDIAQLNAGWLETKNIYSESNDREIKYLICNDEDTLIYMANLGCIEINPWFSRIDNLENPDYLVIDLDPVEIEFDKVVETALVVKEVLDEAGAESYCKTSGATGLHIYVPLGANYDYETAKEFALIIAKLANARVPQITSLERSPSKRKKKVYLDYLQNRKGQTLAAPYSIRPRPGAPVSTPLEWSEVKHGLNPVNFNLKNIFKRLEKKGDLFRKVLGKGINISRCINKLQK